MKFNIAGLLDIRAIEPCKGEDWLNAQVGCVAEAVSGVIIKSLAPMVCPQPHPNLIGRARRLKGNRGTDLGPGPLKL